MATNYLSASLLSTTYQNMLDADDRENEKQLYRALKSAASGGYDLQGTDPLRDGNTHIVSYANSDGTSTEEYWQQVRISNSTPAVWTDLVPTILEKKRNFTEYTVPPRPETERERRIRMMKERVLRSLEIIRKIAANAANSSG
jgi:hypothetical protein